MIKFKEVKVKMKKCSLEGVNSRLVKDSILIVLKNLVF